MAYAKLIEGSGFLAFYADARLKDPARVAAAEAAATLFIDGEFADWDRVGWVGSSVPPEIVQIAEKIGAAEYIDLDLLQRGPQNDRNEEIGESTLRMQAKALVDRAKTRGY